jgi:hypothetical protein
MSTATGPPPAWRRRGGRPAEPSEIRRLRLDTEAPLRLWSFFPSEAPPVRHGGHSLPFGEGHSLSVPALTSSFPSVRWSESVRRVRTRLSCLPAPRAAPSALFPQRSALRRRDGYLCSLNGNHKATCRRAADRFLSPLSLNPSLPIPPVGEWSASVPARGRA